MRVSPAWWLLILIELKIKVLERAQSFSPAIYSIYSKCCILKLTGFAEYLQEKLTRNSDPWPVMWYIFYSKDDEVWRIPFFTVNFWYHCEGNVNAVHQDGKSLRLFLWINIKLVSADFGLFRMFLSQVLFQFIRIYCSTGFVWTNRLTIGKNEKVHNLHVPAIKFIG